MVTFEPIGFMQASQQYKYQQPRQGEFAQNSGTIELLPGCNFEQALEDLEGFSHIWLIYHFHHNNNWRAKVNVPISDDGKKKGLFATRSPYRPNPIGLSCVKLEKIQGRVLTIRDFDLLDGTPILDIKPYVTHYDSIPEASTGWLQAEAPTEFIIEFNQGAQEQAEWIRSQGGPDLVDLARVQLAIDPCNSKRKRVSTQTDGSFVLAFRTWRIHFSILECKIEVTSIHSGYEMADLAPDVEDRWEDKELHRKYLNFLKR